MTDSRTFKRVLASFQHPIQFDNTSINNYFRSSTLPDALSEIFSDDLVIFVFKSAFNSFIHSDSHTMFFLQNI